MPPQPQRPNYFLGFRVTSSEIHSNVLQVQETIRLEFPRLRKCLIDPATLHITLFVLHLTPDQLSTATQVFRNALVQVEPLTVDFEGLKTFGKVNVLYINVKCINRLKQLAKHLFTQFNQAGLVNGSLSKFQPHLTVLKTSKDPSISRKDRVQVAMYDYLLKETPFRDFSFGQQRVEAIELLSMREKEQDGYYTCIDRIPLSN